MSAAEPGSRRSPGGAVLQSMSAVEPGPRRSPGGAVLFVVDFAEDFGCGYFIPNSIEGSKERNGWFDPHQDPKGDEANYEMKIVWNN